MCRCFPVFSALLFLVLAALARAQGPDAGEPDARAEFAARIADLPVLDSSTAAEDERFQFEFRLFSGQNSTEYVSFLCERQDGKAAMLVSNHDGVPYAILSDNGIIALSSDDPPKRIHYKGVTFQLASSRPDLFLNIQHNTRGDPSSIKLDLPAWCKALLDTGVRSEEIETNRPNGTYKFLAGNGYVRTRFSREKGDGAFPVADVWLNLSGTFAVICNIRRDGFHHDVLALADAAHRHFEGRVIEITKIEELGRLDYMSNDILQRTSDPDYLSSAAKFAESFGWGPLIDRDEEAKQLIAAGFDLRAILEGLQAEEVRSEEDSFGALKRFEALIHAHILKRLYYAEDEHENDDSTISLAGYDRLRTRSLLEARVGPGDARNMLRMLAMLASNEQMSPRFRMHAIDLLGTLGVGTSDLFVGIENSIAGRSEPMLRVALASARVRNCAAGSEDVTLLQETLRDAGAERYPAMMCLEALLLADVTEGLDGAFRRWVLEDGNRDPLNLRCWLATPCSDQGVSLLVEACLADPPKVPRYMLGLVIPYLDPANAQHVALLDACEETALDREAAVTTRAYAATIASSRRERTEYRSKFVDSALESGSLELLLMAVSLYIGQDRNALEHVSQITRALDAEDEDVRRSAMLMVVFGARRPVDEPIREQLDDLLEKGKQDSDEDVRALAMKAEELLR